MKDSLLRNELSGEFFTRSVAAYINDHFYTDRIVRQMINLVHFVFVVETKFIENNRMFTFKSFLKYTHVNNPGFWPIFQRRTCMSISEP